MLCRLTNGLRKIAAGLRPFSESVWPGVRNDLFVAHESIYDFFGNYVHGARVLDAGCGTGYGARKLLDAGAQSVVGVDLDAFNIRYAKRHYSKPGLTFLRGNIERLDQPAQSLDIVTASNSLEHLVHPEAFFAGLRRILVHHGKALIAVPPIITPEDAHAHSQIHYHRSNLTIHQWISLFHQSKFDVSCFSHRAAHPGIAPDFRSHKQSTLTSNDFIFVSATPHDLYSEPSITAVFILTLAA
jgi:2-polyprenyl-3-methyl-5-hydroxy-6-metoxy-1,4-benzoquinol methylase